MCNLAGIQGQSDLQNLARKGVQIYNASGQKALFVA